MRQVKYQAIIEHPTSPGVQKTSTRKPAPENQHQKTQCHSIRYYFCATVISKREAALAIPDTCRPP